MGIDFKYRKKQVGTLSTSTGVYILSDLQNVPIYVGQSTDGIRKRVQRHLTSARSDIVANRQVDVWEIAYVWEYPTVPGQNVGDLESALYHHYNPISRLMNGTVRPLPPPGYKIPDPNKVVQVMPEEERLEKLSLELRLPRQAKQYGEIIGHFLAVKNSIQIARAMDAHFERLKKYHGVMLNLETTDDP